MAGPRQAPAPYDGMGTPNSMGRRHPRRDTQAERLDAARADRFAPGTPRHDESEEFVRRSLNRYYQ